MFVDLYHNYIVKNTITKAFEESIEKILVPKLESKYGSALLGMQMYEDYIADAFYARGEWYYPLTVILPEGPITQWIKWRMKAGNFKDGLPYAYIGEGLLDINTVDEAPAEFAEKLENRATFSTAPSIKINIETPAKDPTFLSGRYSQSFVDEMARQLTLRISEAMSVSGLEQGPISLSLVFAPATYMEHTSENVTYRRLLITDGASAPRDFWVKWTREDGAMAYSVSDHVCAECISFEIGEDVPQKVREKEYRFLLAAGGDKYHNAMGRKNITEWREIIKRAIRKGELSRLEAPESGASTDDINAALAAVLGKETVKETVAEPNPAAESDEFARAMAMARAIMAERENEAKEESFVPEIPVAEEAAEVVAEEIRLEPVLEEPVAEEAKETEISFTPVTEEPASAASIFDLSADSFEEIDDEEALEAEETVEEEASEDDIADLAALDGIETAEITAEEAPAHKAEPMPTREELEAKIRAEVEAKIRAEYEARMRAEAEAEAAKLREEKEALRRHNEELMAKAEAEKIRLAKLEEARLAEEEKMRKALDEQLRREAAERQRMAEAAKIALDEARREEEARRLAAEKKAAEEKAAAEKAAAAKKAAEERKMQTKTNEAIAGGIRTKNYTYTSKTVRLLFRRSVDPNITSRIYEIIKTTLEYYGKEKMYMRIKATIPDTTTVNLEFLEIPMEEMALLSNIIKVLGNSGLGIAKAIVE